MKKQYCPYDAINEGQCSDRCPLFDDSEINIEGSLGLCLCQTNYPDIEVIDKREYKK